MEVDRKRHAPATNKAPVFIWYAAEFVSEPIWKRKVKLTLTGFRNLNSPARSDLLHHLRYVGRQWFLYCDWTCHSICVMMNFDNVDSYQRYRYMFKLALSILVEHEIMFHWCKMLYRVRTQKPQPLTLNSTVFLLQLCHINAPQIRCSFIKI